MIEIIPAILPKSFADLETKLARMHEHARAVQVDVVDGIFASNKTWPYTGGEEFEGILSEEIGMPFWQDFDFEFDVMVADALPEIEKYIKAGAVRVVVHGAGGEILDTLTRLQDHRQGDFGIAIGVALLPGDSVGIFAQYKELVDFVQVMGIDGVGFQGKAFDQRALGLITSLREANPGLTIQIDGGVRHENIKELVRAGATRLIVGSAIFAADDPADALHELSHIANS